MWYWFDSSSSLIYIQHFSRSWLSCVDSIIQFNSIMFQPGLLHDHIMIVHIKLIQRMLIPANYSTSLNNITLPVKIVISVNGWIIALWAFSYKISMYNCIENTDIEVTPATPYLCHDWCLPWSLSLSTSIMIVHQSMPRPGSYLWAVFVYYPSN